MPIRNNGMNSQKNVTALNIGAHHLVLQNVSRNGTSVSVFVLTAGQKEQVVTVTNKSMNVNKKVPTNFVRETQFVWI